MHLAFGRPGADRPPGDEVGGGIAVIVSRNSHAAGTPIALISSSRLRAIRTPSLILKLPSSIGSLIIPFQPYGRAGFLEIHTHDDFQFTREMRPLIAQPRRVVPGRHRIVDRTRADDHDKAVVRPEQNAMDRAPRV